MALNKLKFNSLNVTPAASEAIRFNSGANGFETASAGGSLVKIASSTASSSASISFTSGIDSTYKEYIFFFNNIHPASDTQKLTFQADTGTNTNYNQVITSTAFGAYNFENGSAQQLSYDTNDDLAQSTSFQPLCNTVGNDNDQSASGSLHIFDPSSSVFVKHWISDFCISHNADLVSTRHNAGYFNTTTALTRFNFKFESGNIDAGTITMYGVT